MSAFARGKLGLVAAGATVVVVALAGCGSGSSTTNTGSSAQASTPQSQTMGGAATGLKTMSTSIGTVLVNASGHTVYELVGDSAANQICAAGCLAAWPPVMTNGSQVIVNGHPAFTFAGDNSAGQTNGQNVSDQWGRWLALDATGNPISASAPSSSATATTAPNSGGAAF